MRVTGVLIENSKLLIVKQYLSKKRGWSLPGGRLEIGESLEQAIIREMHEETGLNTEIIKLLYLCDIPPSYGILHVSFLLRRVSGQIVLPDNTHDETPISDVRFVDIDDLTQYGFSERFQAIIKNDFCLSGSYMKSKENIGLEIN